MLGSTTTDASRAETGWPLAVGAAGANFIGFGILFAFGLFLTPLATEFETTTGPIAPLFSGSVFCYYLSSALGGRLADRHGPMPVVVFGAIAFPAGLVLASLTTSLWQLYAAYVPLVGLAVGSCYASLIGAVGRRFGAERRARAIAVVLTGVGAGSLVMPLLIRSLLDRYDWRVSFRALAALALVVFAATAWSARRPRPEGNEAGVAGSASGPESLTAATLARSQPFRRLYLSVVLIAPGFYAPLAFLNDYAVAEGVSVRRAAILVAAIGSGSAVSRVVFGATAQRFGPVRQYRVSHVVFVVALLVWLGAGGSFWLLMLSAALHGLGWASWVTAAPLVLADWFGVEDLGFCVGGFYTGLGFGALLGPAVNGFVIDRWGYEPMLVVVIAFSSVSLALLWFVTTPAEAPFRSWR